MKISREKASQKASRAWAHQVFEKGVVKGRIRFSNLLRVHRHSQRGPLRAYSASVLSIFASQRRFLHTVNRPPPLINLCASPGIDVSRAFGSSQETPGAVFALVLVFHSSY